LAQQQNQGVFVQRALALLLRQRGARRLGQRFCLAEVQLGGHARVQAHLARRSDSSRVAKGLA
jgi:hypothetical protein